MIVEEDIADRIRSSFFSLFERERSPNSIHISALPFCLRKEYFNIQFHANQTPTPAMVSGKIHHLSIRHLDYFKGKDAHFEVELKAPLTDDWILSGRADAIAGRTLYEFKFSRRLDGRELDLFYFAQANAYAVMAGCDSYALVKVDRNTYDVRALEGEPDRSAFNVLKERALTLVECLKVGKIPEGPEQEWECKNCAYSVICRRIRNEA